jgi:hypothetical protein
VTCELHEILFAAALAMDRVFQGAPTTTRADARVGSLDQRAAHGDRFVPIVVRGTDPHLTETLATRMRCRELTRRGKRVAMLVSCDEYDRLRAARPSLDQALQAWRARLPADFEGFSDDEVRSWRDPSTGRGALG